MEVTRLKAERRTAVGRNHLKQIRKEGWLPVVLYGGDDKPQSLAISEWEMEQHVRHHHRVFGLEVDGKSQDAYLQEVQWHPITDRILHVDFKRIDLSKPIETEVEIEFVGHPVGAGKGGGLVRDHTDLPVRCLPTEIPDRIEVNVAPLDVDDEVLAKDIVLPPGITLLLEPDEVVCHVAEIIIKEEPAPALAEGVEPEVIGEDAAEDEGETKGETKGEAKDKPKPKEDKE